MGVIAIVDGDYKPTYTQNDDEIAAVSPPNETSKTKQAPFGASSKQRMTCSRAACHFHGAGCRMGGLHIHYIHIYT